MVDDDCGDDADDGKNVCKGILMSLSLKREGG